VAAAGGRVYPAKDGRISKQAFQNMYPQWTALEKARDPHFMSDFWRRVSL
jgi:L-gulonolactone oxidase